MITSRTISENLITTLRMLTRMISFVPNPKSKIQNPKSNGPKSKIQNLKLIAFILMALVFAACGATSTKTESPVPSPTSAVAQAPTPTTAPAVMEATNAPTGDAPVPLREDIQIRKILDTDGWFIRIALDPLTGDLHYMDGQANIYRLSLQPGTGSKGTKVYSAADIGGAKATSGMAFGPDGTLYVIGNTGEGTTNQAIIRKGVPDASGKRTWSTLASTVPYPKSGTQYDHLANGIIVSPDGRSVYVNSGSRTEHGEVQSNKDAFPDAREVPLTSAILRIPADATDLQLPNDEAELKAKGYLFADGTRNSYDLAFAPNGDLFAADNGPDADFPDELNWLREGQHYGFPWRFGKDDNPQQFPDYDPSKDRRLDDDFVAVSTGMYHNDPNFPKPPMAFTDPVASRGPDGDQYRDADGSQKDASDQGQPMYTFTPHRSPLGLSFDMEGALSGEFKGDAFILSWGAAGGTLTDRGEDLLHLELTKAGDNYEARVTQIVRSSSTR